MKGKDPGNLPKASFKAEGRIYKLPLELLVLLISAECLHDGCHNELHSQRPEAA